MIPVIQVFTTQVAISKPFYTTEERERLREWNSVNSFTGYLENDVLHLPDHCRQDPSLPKADVVVLQDVQGYDSRRVHRDRARMGTRLQPNTGWPDYLVASWMNGVLTTYREQFGFNVLAKPWRFGILELRKADAGEFEVWFVKGQRFQIPKREDHQVGIIAADKRLRFMTNCKDDHTFSSGMQRTYSEFDYVLELVGYAEKVVYQAPSKMERKKEIPLLGCKVVDERKILW